VSDSRALILETLSWIITAGLYAFGMGVLCLLGGVGAAGDAFRSWGEAAARNRPPSSAS
jgi:hypothetical protein